MPTSFDQFLIDVYVARREQLVSDEVLHETLADRANHASNQRLGAILMASGKITPEVGQAIDQKGSMYQATLVALGADGELPHVDEVLPGDSEARRTQRDPNHVESGDVEASDKGQRENSPADATQGDFDTLMEGPEVPSSGVSSSPSVNQESASYQASQPSTALRYQKALEHAEGGLGKVWVASDLELNRKVALKEIQPEHADDPNCRSRFLKEAEITGALEHPGIVPVYGLGCHADGRPFYAMRFVEGQTLKHAIDELYASKPKSPFRDAAWRIQLRRVLNRFLDVCNTLDYAHSRQVIHRDIKPSNIMLGAYGETLLVDWGLAKSIAENDGPETEEFSPGMSGGSNSHLTMLGTAVGTPAYMSPEQACGGKTHPVGVASDVYSLGATFFHLLVGQPPGGQSSAASQIPGEVITTPRTLRPDLPPPLASICQKALAHDPTDRYQSAKELATDVENWLGDQPVGAHQETTSERAARWVRTHPTLAVSTAVAGVLLIAAALAGLSFRNQYNLDMLKKQQEQDRLAESHVQKVASAIDAARASALAEIRNNRFEAATEFLDTALAQLESEPSLSDRREDLVAVRHRTQQLLDFYALTEDAEELTFRDSSRRASALFQKALFRIGVFQQLEWWNALPTQDLDPAQVHRLRTRVYRAMFLLTSLRLKETIPVDLNVQEMFKLVSDQSRTSNQASLILCDLLDAYRESQGAYLGRRFAKERTAILNQLIQGIAFRQKTIEWEPMNSSDLYIMGAALAYMVINTTEADRQPFETLLGIEDADAVSQVMLRQASELQNDHYWTQLVRAFFEVQRNDYQAGSRSYLHAISLNPEHWLGYSWFGSDSRQYAVTLKEDDPRRRLILQKAIRSLERAVDLKPDARIAHTHRGDALTWVSTNPRQVVASYLIALGLQEPLGAINDMVVEQVDRWHLESTRTWCRNETQRFPDYAELHSAVAWSELILGNEVEAEKAASAAIKVDDSNRVALLVRGTLASRRGDWEQAEDILRTICDEHADWFHGHFARAQNSEQANRWDDAYQHYRLAYETSEANWQQFYAQRNIARAALRLDPTGSAMTEAELAIELAKIEPLDDVLKDARTHQVSNVEQAIEAYHTSLKPITQLASAEPVRHLPLLNGGFELGLVPCWGDTLAKIDAPAWQTFDSSLATASVVDDVQHTGRRSLYIANPAVVQSAGYAELTQRLPIDASKTYSLTGWVRSELCEPGAIEILAGETQVVEMPRGTYDWQKFQASISTDSPQLDFRIRCKGRAEVWIDSLAITAD